MKTNYSKNCPNCGNIQYYTTHRALDVAITKNGNCGSCSISSQKKIYDEVLVNDIIEKYNNGVSFSKISLELNIRRDNVKKILQDKGIWVENRDNIKKEFTTNEIDEIVNYYINDNLSCEKIGDLYNVSKNPIKRILKNLNLLRQGNSGGKKIDLTEYEKNTIKKLYLEEKNSKEISDILGLTKSFIDKFLSLSEYRRSKSEATSISKTGVKVSELAKLNMSIAQKTLIQSGKRKQRGGFCKYFNIHGLQVQGTYEKFYIEKLVNDGKFLPKNCESINTPYGTYYPDFTYDDRLIEIKSDYTYDILIGNKKYWHDKEINIQQYLKIKWVNENLKPVDILIIDKKNNKIIKKNII